MILVSTSWAWFSFSKIRSLIIFVSGLRRSLFLTRGGRCFLWCYSAKWGSFIIIILHYHLFLIKTSKFTISLDQILRFKNKSSNFSQLKHYHQIMIQQKKTLFVISGCFKLKNLDILPFWCTFLFKKFDNSDIVILKNKMCLLISNCLWNQSTHYWWSRISCDNIKSYVCQ